MAVILEIITNNRNRIASEIRHIFDKAGGSMGATGCVSWMFDKKGVLVIERTPDIDEDTLMMQALDAGASDFQPGEDVFEVICEPADFSPLMFPRIISKRSTGCWKTLRITMMCRMFSITAICRRRMTTKTDFGEKHA